MDRDQVAARIRQYFEAHAEGIACVYLFGSVARGEATGSSDVDVAVLFSEAPPSTLSGSGLRLEGLLERQIGRPVDLVVLNCAPVDLVHRVLRDGELVFERLPAERVRFEVRARNAWFDLKPILDEYRRAGRSVDG